MGMQEFTDPSPTPHPLFQAVLLSCSAHALWFPGKFPLGAQRAETFRLIQDLSASIIFKQDSELQGTQLLSSTLSSLKPLAFALTPLVSGQLCSFPSPSQDDPGYSATLDCLRTELLICLLNSVNLSLISEVHMSY